MELDPSQQAAVDMACSEPFCVITGGPGTGKSTCLRVVLDRLDRNGVRYALASPTGKAAKRMNETTGREASTIHRLLGWTKYGWAHNGSNPLPFDVVIIDESSMLDIELCAALADALHDATRLVLVGDANQLPSVGPGRILADLVESGAVPVARLTHVHRAAAESWVCRNAPRVLTGEGLELAKPQHDFRYFPCESADDAARKIAELAASPDYPGAQVLSPQRTTACGVDALNAQLQATLNPEAPSKAEWTIGERTFRVGDRVIHTQNSYVLMVFNGEVGEVRAINSEGMHVDFGDRVVAYQKDSASMLELAYALTVHKSQGSEFGWVIAVVHSAHTYMLTRQLFYTAITRAKTGVLLVGNSAGIRAATSEKAPPKRNTALVARMAEYAAAADNDNGEEPLDDARTGTDELPF